MNRLSPAIFRFLAVSAFALAVPLSALADQGPGRGPDHHGGRPPEAMIFHLLHGVDLSEPQRTQIKTLADAQREQMQTAMQSVHSQRQALRQLALSDKYDAAAVKAASEQLGRAEGDIARLAAEGVQKVYAVLTPEQRTSLQQRMSQRDMHHDHRG
jgi:protein CpxP